MKLTASLYLASILFFSLASDCVADSKVEGLEFLLPFQGRRSCIVVSNGVSAVEELHGLANRNGLMHGSEGKIAFIVKHAFFFRVMRQKIIFL